MPRAWVLAVALLIFLWGTSGALRADVVANREQLYRDYGAKLAELAAWCQEQKLPEAVAELEAWLPERQPDQLTLFVLPPWQANSAEEQPEWRRRWQQLRNEQAEALVALARQALKEGRPSLVYELVTEAVRENPAHKQGRRMLGYVSFRDGWHTPFEIRQLTANKTLHEKFGWLPQAHVARYEAGERYYSGRWISAEEEAALRRDLKRGWRIESEHYVVTTNHSLEEGVALSRRLEAFHRLWQQVFISYLANDTELARRFEGRAPKRDARQHQVVYFRDRQEYNSTLGGAQPRIDITLGIYFDRNRTAYFFAGDEQDPGTLYHEATHQLFGETRPVVADVGRAANFWAIEGIACYLESLEHHAAGYYTLGGANAGRVPAARHRLLEDGFYVPLAELTGLGLQTLQSDPRIARLYSQSAGLATFFMHAEQGRYREPLVRYLEAIYTGRASAKTLAELTGQTYDALDRQYREFLSTSDTDAEPSTGEN